MPYEENLDQNLHKILQKILEQKDKKIDRLLFPKKIMIEMVKRAKTFLISMEEQMVPVSWLIDRNHHFSVAEILDAAISGIISIVELHSLNLIHGAITPKSCYFYTAERKRKTKKGK